MNGQGPRTAALGYQCMKSQISMITGIGTPIIQSNIERMLLFLVPLKATGYWPEK